MAIQVKTITTLSAQDERFIIALCLGASASEAARRAAWSESNGAHALRRATMQAVLRSVHKNLSGVIQRIDKLTAETEANAA